MASNNMSPLRNFLNSIKNSVYNISIDGIGNTDINAGSFFDSFKNLYKVTKLNNTNCINITYDMFHFCSNLTAVSNFDTSNVTNMDSMFAICSNLTNVPNFNTSKVTNMSYMFDGCRKIKNIPNFNTSKVKFMNLMFAQCHNLINVPNFNTSNVTNMYSMFQACIDLINIPNLNTSKVVNMSDMFASCYKIVNIPNFNTSNAIDMSGIFYGSNSLINIPNFDTSNVVSFSDAFHDCHNLINIPVINIINVTKMNNTFKNSNNLSQASVNNIVTSCSTASKVTNKNWTNIGFNVAAGSKWNTWIRTAPDYMNAVNIGWQNIGDAIKSDIYKRRIMVGDNLTGKNIYFEPYELNEFGNYCRNTYYKKKPENMMDVLSLSVDGISDIVYENWDTFNIKDSSYVIEGPNTISNLTNRELYVYNSNGASILSNCFKINNNKNVIVENITHRYPLDDNAPVGDETSYRAFYIEDENIKPLEVGDVIGPNTKFYFTLPDNIFELYANNQSNDLSVMPLAPPVGESIIKSNNIDIFTIGNIAEPIIHFGTTLNGYQIFSSIGEIINESIYTVNLTDDLPESNGNLLPITEYNNFDFWSKYILVDTRTLYRNVKVGDNLRNRTFYFTFPDNMYTDPEMTETSSVIACSNPYFAFSSSNFDAGSQHIAYVQVTWNGNTVSWSTNNQSWSTTSGMQPYQGGDYGSSNWDILYTQCDSDLIVTTITENNAVYKNIYIKEEELPLTLEEQALRLARSYYFNTTSGSGYTFSVATTRGEDVFVIQVTKNAAVQMWLTVNTTLGVVLEGSSNPTNEDYALALAEKYYKENYGNDTVYYGVATQKSETEFVIQVTQNAAVLMFLNVNVSTGEVTER